MTSLLPRSLKTRRLSSTASVWVALLFLSACASSGLGPRRAGLGGEFGRLDPRVTELFVEAQLVLMRPAPVGHPDQRASTAAELLKKAVRLEPRSAALQRHLAEAWSVVPALDRAATAAQRSARLDPQDGRTQLLLGEIQALAGALDAAEGSLRLAVQLGVGGREPEAAHAALARLLVDRGASEKALASLASWAAAFPGSVEPAAQEAALLWSLGRAEASVNAAVEALMRDPDHVGAAEILARHCRYDPTREVATWEGVLHRDRSVTAIRSRLVDLYEQIGRYDKALDHLRYVPPPQDPRQAAGLVRRKAWLRWGMHEGDRAEELLRAGSEQGRSGEPENLLLLAEVLGADPARRSEAKHLLSALVHEPAAHVQATALQARLELDEGRPARALAVALSTAQLLPATASSSKLELLEVAFQAQLEQEEFDSARRLLEEMKLVQPSVVDHYQVQLLRGQGKLEEILSIQQARIESVDADLARVDLNHAISARYEAREELRWMRSWWLLQRAFTEKESGELAAAEATLGEVLEVHPHNPDAANALAYFLSLRGAELQRAEGLSRLALEQRPYSGAYQDTLGWILYGQGRLGEAVEVLEMASRYAPGEQEILDHLEQVRAALSQEQD